eukprot:scaffold59674_cov63-Phaeocystis_antarctica.AAC.3
MISTPSVGSISNRNKLGAIQLWQRHEAASSDPHPKRSHKPRSIGQAAHEVYRLDLLTAEGKLEEDATHSVAGAVAISYQWNKNTAKADQPSCEHQRLQSSCYGRDGAK